MADTPTTPTAGAGRELTAALRRLWAHLGPHRRAQCAPLLLLTVATALAEVCSIAAAMILLGALSAPEQLLAHPAVGAWMQRVGVNGVSDVRLAASAVFAAAALVTGLLRIALSRFAAGWSFAVGADLDAAIFRRTLFQPYSVHIARHSSEVIAGATRQSEALTYQTLAPCLSVVNTSLMMAMVLTALVAWRPLAAIGAFIGFLAIYSVVAFFSKRLIVANGEAAARASARVVRLLQEGLGGIRDVLIDGTQTHYARRFAEETRRLRTAQGSIQFLATCPRYGVEALGMALIAGGAWLSSRQGGGFEGALTTIGALAFSAQRLLPMLQEAYFSYTTLMASRATLLDVLGLLDQPEPQASDCEPGEALVFRDTVRLEQLGFQYGPTTPWILRGVSLDIPRGERIGIIGRSGEGKSTLLDLIVGLLMPGEGRLSVDGVPVTPANCARWRARIAQVPQSIHLSDSSVEENIAVGVPVELIDPVRVRHAARKARIDQAIEALPQGYRTRIGENGSRLSGGQRQRIGIARALYKNADVLILDEATSALDTATERDVIDTIEALGRDVTVIMVAHRLTTLERCDRIVRIEGGRIVPVHQPDPRDTDALGLPAPMVAHR
jgi:ABC-type multidrug transport system fused ATPase/permease subunit